MPTAMRKNGFRLFFYSNEGTEPPHVHVERQSATAKFWLDEVELAGSQGFAPHELTLIRTIVRENRRYLREVWDDFFCA